MGTAIALKLRFLKIHMISLVTCGSCERELATWGAIRSLLEKGAFELASDPERGRLKFRKLSP